MKLTKDTYEYLTGFADDRTILNMLSVNKTFRDEKFFERVMRRKYPFLFEFKKSDESWKDFFISMVHANSRIEEEFGIPYFQVPGYDPRQMIRNNEIIRKRHVQTDPEKALQTLVLHRFASGGNLEAVKFVVERKGADPYNGIGGAAENGHLEVVKYLLSKKDSPTYRGYALERAAEGGRMDVIQYLLTKEISPHSIQRAMFLTKDSKISKYLEQRL